MSAKQIIAVPEPPCSNPVLYNPQVCNGCNICVNICQVDILFPNEEKGKPPLVFYPGECYYCGCCVASCPKPGAITLNLPVMHRVRWKRKATGEHFRMQ